MLRFSPATRSLAVLALSPLLAPPAAAQVILDRVAPIVRADGFEVLPSRQLGMGGVSIAFSDTFADPWSNPAAGARTSGARAFGSPVAYGVSGRAGGGEALPLGVIGRSGVWFGGGALALQSVEPGRVEGFTGPVFLDVIPVEEGEAAPSLGSLYAFALLGRSWPERGLSLAGSVATARRHAVDGIGLLYDDGQLFESAGAASTFRLGLLHEGAGGGSFEAVAVHARTRMAHEVVYADWVWDPDTQMPTMTPREERNADDADVWGLQLLHVRPLGAAWRIGWLVTANVAAHPAVPRYDAPRDGITNIEGGRGAAYAWNLGVGVARDAGDLRLGADLIYEPIRSRIWGEDPTGTTVENRIHYSNGIVRLGAGREWRHHGAFDAADAQLGVEARFIDYRLAQLDHRQDAGRDEHRRWVEWTPTLGGGLRIGEVRLRYHASVLYGTERPGSPAPRFGPCDRCLLAEPAPADGFLGPVPGRTEPVPVTVVIQQLFFSVAVGGGR